jgi:hypothetical protein
VASEDVGPIVEYLGHLADETIEAMLNELSIELGAALGQELDLCSIR